MSNIFAEMEKQRAGEVSNKAPNIFAQMEAQHAADISWGDALIEGAKNLPKSAKKYVVDIIDAVKNYKQTGPALARTFAGAVESAIPGEQGDEPYFRALVDSYKETYGTVANFKKAIANDPVTILNDASMVLMGAGTVLKGAGMGGKISRMGDIVTKTGGALEPVSAITTAGSKLLPEALSNKMYRQSAKFAGVKPGKGLTAIEKEKQMAELAIKENIMPTTAGIYKIQDIQSVLMSRLDEAIAKSGTGVQMGKWQIKKPAAINVDDLFKGFDELRESWAFAGGESTKGIAQIDRAQASTRKTLKNLLRKKELTLEEAQKLKRTIYKVNESAYGKTKKGTAFEEAQKLIATNAREFIESIVPEAKGINAGWAEFEDLKKALDKAAQRIGHREPLANLGMVTKTGTGGVIGGGAGAAMGATLGTLDYPTVQAKLAIWIRALKNKGAKISPAMVTARILTAKSKYMANQSSSEPE